MASAIGPGDWVECVDASPCPRYGDPGLRLGALYQVARTERRRDEITGYEGDGVLLSGYRHPSRGVEKKSDWLGASRFRPIYRPKADLIESLKAPVTRTPQVVREKSRETA